MRLSSVEKESIKKAIEKIITPKNAQLYLFGSRVHDHLKGGDIDLLLIFKNIDCSTSALKKKLEILIEIKDRIGEQKIDLIITNSHQLTRDSFIEMIFFESLQLHSWP